MGIAWLVSIFAAKGIVSGFGWNSTFDGAISGSILGARIGVAIAAIICPMYILWKKFDRRSDNYSNIYHETLEVPANGAVGSIAMAVVGLIIGTEVKRHNFLSGSLLFIRRGLG